MSTYPPAQPLANVVRRTIIGFGDSITNQNFDAVASTPPSYSARGDINWANAILGSPFTIAGNGGVSGETTTQMLARLPTILSYQASIVRFLGGTNDQPSIAAGDINTSGTTIYNIYTICEALRTAGSLVVLCTVPPNGFMVGTGTDNTRRAHFSTVNRWVRSYAASTKGIVLCDYARVLADPNAAGPLTYTTADGVHPTAYGAVLMGMELASTLTPYVASCNLAANYPFDHTNYAINPLAHGNNASGTNGFIAGTGITGNGPNGWVTARRNTGTAVVSKVTRADARYSDSLARMVLTAGITDYSGGSFSCGSDDIQATGRYDQGWVANTAYTIGARKKPTTANGYIYVVVVAGTTGATQPTWPTTEGHFVVDNTVTWMCQLLPQVGDQFYGVAEVTMSGLTAGLWANPYIQVYAMDTTGASMGSVFGMLGNLSAPSPTPYPESLYLPSTPIVIRTPVFSLREGTNSTPRYLVLKIAVIAQAGATVTMDVGRVGIYRVSP